MTDGQIEVGVGTSEYVSYVLTILNTQNDVLWEGQVEAKEVINSEEQLALEFENGMPHSVMMAIRSLPTYHASWEVMGKDVTHALIMEVE